MSNEPPSPNFNRWPTLLLLAVAIFGPPSAIVLTFTHAVTQNPWLTAMLIVAYEVLVFLVTRVAKIWQKLEEPWIEQVAEWIKHRVKDKVSGYQGQYSQPLIYQHRNFDMRALNTQNIFTLKLDQGFVELHIDPTLAH